MVAKRCGLLSRSIVPTRSPKGWALDRLEGRAPGRTPNVERRTLAATWCSGNRCTIRRGMSVRYGLLALLAVVCVAAHAGAGEPQDAVARGRQIYERALEVETQGNHLASLPLLWEAAGLAPHDADIQNHLGEALERLGALDAAIDAYRQALADRPDFRKASNNLILAMVKAGKGSEGVARARALAAAAPDDPDRLFTLGLAQAE